MAIPRFRPAQSTAVELALYDQELRQLHVIYVGGREYVYADVPASVFEELKTAESVGTFVNRRIKPKYRNYWEVKPERSRPTARPADRRPDRQREDRPGP